MPFSRDDLRRPSSRRHRRDAATLDAAALERAALAYLERYDSSSANLRRVLERKVRRALAAQERTPAHAELEQQAAAWIDRAVAKVIEQGFVDDRRYAEALSRRLLRRGLSHRSTSLKLRQKGVPGALAQEVLGSLRDPDHELRAATAYARRRRLGPFRDPLDPEAREARRRRDLAALARRGFDGDVARRVIDAEDPEQLPGRPPGSAFG